MLLFKRYEYNPQTDLIGKGGFSRVYKALDKKFNRYLALKIYKTNELSERYSPIAEIQRVIGLDHPNISRYIDIEEIETEDSFGQVEKIQVCVMELLEGGNFAKYYDTHKDLDVFKKLLIDVLHGLAYLHRNGIIHRDIKPANILIKQHLDGPVAKITDFGISKKSDSSGNSSSSALIVSIPYMAPEQLNAQKYGIDEKVHYNIDLWSLGVAVYEIITGDVLFKNNDYDSSEQIMTNIIAPELPEKIKSLPAPFDEFVARCIIKDAKQRVQTAEELILMLQPQLADTTSIASTVKAKIGSNTNGFKTEDTGKTQSTDRFSSPAKNKQEDSSANDTTSLDDTAVLFNKPTSKESEPVNNTDETQVIVKPAEPIASAAGEDNQPASDDTRIFDITAKLPGETSDVSGSNEQSPDDTQLIQTVPEKIPEASPDIPDGNNTSKEPIVEEVEPEEIKEPETITETTAEIKKEDIEPLMETSPQPQTTEVIPDFKNTEAPKKEAPVASPAEDTVLLAKPATENEHPKVTLFNRYDYYPVTDMIGKGGFSRVYKAFDKKLGRWVALKIYKTSEFSDRYSPIAEIKRVVNLDHSNICRYLDIEEIEKINPFGEVEKIQVCVMELMDSGNFLEYFNKSGKDLEVLKKLLSDILHGISYLHKNGIIHRDIKPANILIKKTIEGPVAKITDFGISKVSDSVNNNSSSALIVSIPYMAPEQLNTKKYGINEKIAFNLDLWSLGVTIYEVITGKVLFKNSDQDSSEQIMANIMAPEIPEKIKELPHPFRDIVSHCIVKNANDRAQKAEELLVLLNSSTAEPVPTSTPLITPEPPKERKSLVQTGTAGMVKTTDSPLPVVAEEPPVKKKFVLAEETPKKEKKVIKHISVLKISVAAAALLLIVSTLLYFNINRKAKKETASSATADSVNNKTAITPPVENAAPPVTKPEVIKTTISTEDSPQVDKSESLVKKPETNRKKESKQKQDVAKNDLDVHPGKSSSDKYVLFLTTKETCQVRKNGQPMPELRPGQRFQLALAPGSTYIISATSREGKTYSKTIDVSHELAGRSASLNIKF